MSIDSGRGAHLPHLRLPAGRHQPLRRRPRGGRARLRHLPRRPRRRPRLDARANRAFLGRAVGSWPRQAGSASSSTSVPASPTRPARTRSPRRWRPTAGCSTSTTTRSCSPTPTRCWPAPRGHRRFLAGRPAPARPHPRPGRRATLDLDRPVGLLLVGVLHVVPDDDDRGAAWRVWSTRSRPAATSCVPHDERPVAGADIDHVAVASPTGCARATRPRSATGPGWPRSSTASTVVEPGIVPVNQWRPDADTRRRPTHTGASPRVAPQAAERPTAAIRPGGRARLQPRVSARGPRQPGARCASSVVCDRPAAGRRHLVVADAGHPVDQQRVGVGRGELGVRLHAHHPVAHRQQRHRAVVGAAEHHAVRRWLHHLVLVHEVERELARPAGSIHPASPSTTIARPRRPSRRPPARRGRRGRAPAAGGRSRSPTKGTPASASASARRRRARRSRPARRRHRVARPGAQPGVAGVGVVGAARRRPRRTAPARCPSRRRGGRTSCGACRRRHRRCAGSGRRRGRTRGRRPAWSQAHPQVERLRPGHGPEARGSTA